MELFLKTLLALSIGGSLMAALLYGLKLILRDRLSSSVYYYLWLLVLLRFMLPLPGLMPLERPEQSQAPASYSYESVAPGVQEQMRRYQEPRPIDMQSPDREIPLPASRTAAEPETQESPFSTPIRIEPLPLIFALWAMGAAFSFLNCALSYLRFSRAVRQNAVSPEIWEWRCYRSIHDGPKPELIKSLYISTPMLMGIFRPCLVLPDREYTEEILTNIFLHELKHYSRRDLVYKWFAVLALSLHWFNPLAYLVRREINRACEMSCDEMLISKMDREQRQSYGETLISLAARRPLPAGIVATSFAMEKRDLKERLTKIMRYRKTSTSVIAALLCLVMLAGCGAVSGPGADAVPGPEVSAPVKTGLEPSGVTDSGVSTYHVSTVDELIAALGPDRVIFMEPGVYELSAAEGYGVESGEYYSWLETYDGYELLLADVNGLSLVGGEEKTEIVTRPRYANVLRLEDCSNITIEGLTLGHSPEDGSCSGGVLYFDSCSDVDIYSSSLYGCGTVGILAVNCKRLYAVDSEIYDCSYNAVYASASHDVMLLNCKIYDHGDSGYFDSLFCAETSNGFALVNCEIYDNEVQRLLTSNYSQQVYLLGCTVRDNMFYSAMINASGYSPIVDKSSFEDADRFVLYEGLPAVDAQGDELSLNDFVAMERKDAEYSGPVEAAPVALDETVNAEGLREVTVSTVDEFLAAIGNDTVIKLEGELFDLSTASDYGAYGNDYYYWVNIFDGPGLVISGVSNLSIVGEGCTIAAIPRYADVLSFINCENISLSGFTAGHTEEPGQCAGGVLKFQNCWDIDIDDCRLFGCGIIGISASDCSELNVKNTEIYDCSQGAIALYTVMDASFENMNIHDCHIPEIGLTDSMNVSFDGQELDIGQYYMDNGVPKVYEWPGANIG